MPRVVITGIGLITPVGNDRDPTWSALIACKSGASPYFEKRDLKHYDRFLQLGVGAALMAMDDAGYANRRVPEGEEDDWGVYIGAGLGGLRTLEDTHDAAKAKGPRYGFSPYFVPDMIINMAPGL